MTKHTLTHSCGSSATQRNGWPEPPMVMARTFSSWFQSMGGWVLGEPTVLGHPIYVVSTGPGALPIVTQDPGHSQLLG